MAELDHLHPDDRIVIRDPVADALDRELAAVESRFSYQPPKPDDGPKYDRITSAIRDVAIEIVRTVPAGRERASALTCLAEARMHANAGIALAGTKGA